jgi:hypothetical protein
VGDPPDAVRHDAALGGGGLAPAGMNLLKLMKTGLDALQQRQGQ